MIRMARVSAVLGLPLWMLSYSWLVSAGIGSGLALYLTVIGELGALLAGSFALVVGLTFRGRLPPRGPDYRTATQATALGALVLVLVIIPNIAGVFWTAVV